MAGLAETSIAGVAAKNPMSSSKLYGRVVLWNKDNRNLTLVTENGSLCDILDHNDVERMRVWLRKTVAARHQRSKGAL